REECGGELLKKQCSRLCPDLPWSLRNERSGPRRTSKLTGPSNLDRLTLPDLVPKTPQGRGTAKNIAITHSYLSAPLCASAVKPENRSMDTHSDPIGDSPHSLGNRLGRVLWAFTYTLLFRLSPRPLHRWRNLLLRLFGAKLHPTSRVYPRARVWAPWNLVMH